MKLPRKSTELKRCTVTETRWIEKEAFETSPETEKILEPKSTKKAAVDEFTKVSTTSGWNRSSQTSGKLQVQLLHLLNVKYGLHQSAYVTSHVSRLTDRTIRTFAGDFYQARRFLHGWNPDNSKGPVNDVIEYWCWLRDQRQVYMLSQVSPVRRPKIHSSIANVRLAKD